jgi:transposase-like protein
MNNSINQKIKQHCIENRVPFAKLAQKLGYNRSSLYALLNRSDMFVSTLLRISQELSHNFFQYLWVDKTILTYEEGLALRKEISNLKAQISQLTRENELLQKIVSKI